MLRWWQDDGFRCAQPILRFLLLLALAEVILARAHGRTRGGIRIERLLAHGGDAAVLAHLEHVEARRRALVHPVPAFELRGHAIDRALDAERLVAADAAERLFLLEHACRRGGGAEI